MDTFDGLRDGYDALVGAFHREDRKEIDRLGSRESEGYLGQTDGNGQSAVDEKLKTISKETRARRWPDPQRF